MKRFVNPHNTDSTNIMNNDPTSTSSRCSSTPRTAASLNTRQPIWRRSSLARNPGPSTAVSVVYAEPQQASHLNSASDALLSTPGSHTVEHLVNREIDDTSPSGSSQTANQISSLSELASQSPLRDPTDRPQRRIRKRSSLFASMSRAKGKTTLSHLGQDQPQQPLAPITQPINVPQPPFGFLQQSNAGTQINGPTIEHQSPQLLPPGSSRSSTPTESITTVVQLQGRSYSIPQQPSFISSSSSSPASSPPSPYYSPADIQSPPSIELANPILHSTDIPGVTFANPSKESTGVKQTTSNSVPSFNDRIPSLPPMPPAYFSPTFSNSRSVMSSAPTGNSSSRSILSLNLPWGSKIPPDSELGKGDINFNKEVTTSVPNPTLHAKTSSESFVESPPPATGRSAEALASTSISADIIAVSPTPDKQQRSSSPPLHPKKLNDNSLMSSSTTSVDDAHVVSLLPTALNNESSVRTPETPSKHVQHKQEATWWDYVWTSSSKVAGGVVGNGLQEAGDKEGLFEGVVNSFADIVASNTTECARENVSARTEPIQTPLEPTTTNNGLASSEPRNMQGASKLSAWYTPWYTASTTGNENTVEGGTETQVEVVEKDVVVASNSRGSCERFAQSGFEPDISPEDTQSMNQSSMTTEASIQNLSPIATSLESNTTSWASFFSTWMHTTKRISNDFRGEAGGRTVKRDEDGMEVMDIDEDGDETSSPGGRNDESKAVGGGEKNTTDPATFAWSPIHSFYKSDTGKKLITAPPLMISDELKKGTGIIPTKRFSTVSTPKKGNSGTATPIPPSPSSSLSGKHAISMSSATETTKYTITTTNTKTLTPTSTTSKRVASPAPSRKSVASSSPNLVLPTWQDTFFFPPRNILLTKPHSYADEGVGGSLLGKTMKFMSGVLWAKDSGSSKFSSLVNLKGKDRAREGSSSGLDDCRTQCSSKGEWTEKLREFGKELPKAWLIVEEAGGQSADILRGCRRVVAIGIHGWFPGAMIRTVLGEPTGTSTKFASMMEQALLEFEAEHDVKFEKISIIPLEGEGTIEKRVEKLLTNLKANQQWMADLREADGIIIATHSQGSIVSTHLLDQLIRDKHIVTHHSKPSLVVPGTDFFSSAIRVDEAQGRTVQRVCCLALCGIHLGPLRYLNSNTLVGPYLQYFESIAARELFEFQNTESRVSKEYVKALENVLNHGVKMVYIASLNDQVVPIYSGLFTAMSHPLILRGLYVDSDAHHSSDFLSKLLVVLLRMLNCGISDSGLLAHLSEAMAGSLSGIGHSTAYEELACYSLAVKYLFLADSGCMDKAELRLEPFNANHEQNDYEIPWSLRDIIADEHVALLFSQEILELRDAFRDWHPKTTILRDLKRKLQPITRLPTSFATGHSSKL